MSYTEETIVVKNPSPKLMDLVEKMREKKRIRREALRNKDPMFNIQL